MKSNARPKTLAAIAPSGIAWKAEPGYEDIRYEKSAEGIAKIQQLLG